MRGSDRKVSIEREAVCYYNLSCFRSIKDMSSKPSSSRLSMSLTQSSIAPVNHLPNGHPNMVSFSCIWVLYEREGKWQQVVKQGGERCR